MVEVGAGCWYIRRSPYRAESGLSLGLEGIDVHEWLCTHHGGHAHSASASDGFIYAADSLLHRVLQLAHPRAQLVAALQRLAMACCLRHASALSEDAADPLSLVAAVLLPRAAATEVAVRSSCRLPQSGASDSMPCQPGHEGHKHLGGAPSKRVLDSLS